MDWTHGVVAALGFISGILATVAAQTSAENKEAITRDIARKNRDVWRG